MKIQTVIVLSFILLTLTSRVEAQISSGQLGRLILLDDYDGVSQGFLEYYTKGPTGVGTMGGYHPGIDYYAEIGTPVRSPVRGVVSDVSSADGRVAIKISGTSNRHFIFAHLDKIFVRLGKYVEIGDTVGNSGNKGPNSHGPHLHVEVRLDKTTAAYYLKSSASKDVAKTHVNPRYQVALDAYTKTAWVFNILELDYPDVFPEWDRLGKTTTFLQNGKSLDANRRYSVMNNRLFVDRGVIKYSVGKKTTSTNGTVDDWLYFLGWY